VSDALQTLEKALSIAVGKSDLQAAGAITAEMKRLLREENPAVDAPRDLQREGAEIAAGETGAMDAIAIGAGRKVAKLGSGIKQAFLGLPSYPLTADLNERERRKLATDEKANDAVYSALQDKRPVATAAGEVAPFLAVPPSMGVVPVAATVAAIEGAGYGTPGERAGRAALGGATTLGGGVAGKFVGNLVSPVSRRAAGESHQAGLDALERIGGRPTLGEATGNSFVRKMEDYVARAPGGSSVMQAFEQEGRQIPLNRAAAASIGETVEELSPEVFARASQRIGKVFNDIKSLPGRQIQLGPDVVAAADEILRQQGKMLPHQQDQNLIKIARDAKAIASNKGRIDGETYQLQRSGLSDAAFDATVGTNKRLYGRLLEALDDSADASLRSAGNDALADALKVARPQYANLKLLEKGATTESGQVSAAKVASTMRTDNPGAFRRGANQGEPLDDVARVGETLKPLRQGSQTFERQAFSNPASLALNWLWSAPLAHATTSRFMTLYPRTLGNTSGARVASEIVNPSTRAAVAAALQGPVSRAVPFTPVAAE
jgi:hypothetical protein